MVLYAHSSELKSSDDELKAWGRQELTCERDFELQAMMRTIATALTFRFPAGHA
jgi:hypothetical protein